MKTLYLILHREWFDLIASGKKTSEFREYKPYWTIKLQGVAFTEINFKNGYAKDAPVMRVRLKKIIVREKGEAKPQNGEILPYKCYELVLGEILEIENWNGVA